MSDHHSIPVNRAILWILLSTLFASGSALMGWLYYLHVRELRLKDDQYRVVAIVQRTPQSDALKGGYLAELLDLSLDRPINLYQFNSLEARKKLLNHPLIKKADVKKILPGTLYIDYSMRTPLAFVADLANTVIDEEGYLFPFRPFFTPKRLPTVYLGLNNDEYQWGNCLKCLVSVRIAFDLLRQFECLMQDKFFLKQLDVSRAQADSYCQRQIVMVLERERQQKAESAPDPLILLRLSTENTEQNLANFHSLYPSLVEKKGKAADKDRRIIIDFRVPHLAFIQTEK